MDIVMQVHADEVRRVFTRLGEGFVLDAQIGFETKLFTTKHKIRARHDAFLIEVFELSDDPHDRSQFERRRQVEVASHRVWIASAEDVIVPKLRWARVKDLEDVKGVIPLQHAALDWPYINQWCATHGTLDRLNMLRANLPPDG